MTLSVRHALVSGGGSGIGKAIALALADAGVEVTICGRRREVLDAVRHPRIHAHVCDVTDEEAVIDLYREAQELRGPFDLVVANAGGTSSGLAMKLTLEEWNRILATNLTGAFLTVKPALAPMTKKAEGRIIFVASTAGLKGYSYVAPYVAAKHGVVGLTRALAAETAKSGVTVNAVCPGFTETPLLHASLETIIGATGQSEDDARAALTNPQGRFVEPEEVAAAVLWLASDEARSVTGQAISVSGGET